MNRNRNIFIFVLISAAAVACDQYTKAAMQEFMAARGGEELVIIPGLLSFVQGYNTGVAFGMFQGAQPYIIFIPVILVIVMVAALFRYSGRSLSAMGGVSLMLGGAIGNLIDRLRSGRVFDFIDFHIGDAHWPAFNAADSFIVIGTFIFAFFFIIRGDEFEQKEQDHNTAG